MKKYFCKFCNFKTFNHVNMLSVQGKEKQLRRDRLSNGLTMVAKLTNLSLFSGFSKVEEDSGHPGNYGIS